MAKAMLLAVATAGVFEGKRRLVERSGLGGLGGDFHHWQQEGVESSKFQDLEFKIPTQRKKKANVEECMWSSLFRPPEISG